MSILYAGLDAGGSKTALVAVAEGTEPSFEMVGPAANLQRLGLDATASVLADLIRQAAARHDGTTHVKACVGIAGAGRPEEAKSVASRWREMLASSFETDLLVLHDGEIALDGAFRGESGAVVIAGTGSLVLARSRTGELVRGGGWGYLLGDEGSGHAIGLAGLRAVTVAIDGDVETSLRRALASEHGLSGRDQIIQAVYRDHFPVQSIAPTVLRLAADAEATCTDIIRRGTRLLAKQLASAAARARHVEPRAALVGGLTRNETYSGALAEAILGVLPGWRVVEPLATPAAGALQRAMAL